MNIHQIELALSEIVDNDDRAEFAYDLLLAYGTPRSALARLRSGDFNSSKIEGEILWKRKLYFKAVLDQDLHDFIDDLRREKRITSAAPRFIVVTDFTTILAYDTKTKATLDDAFDELSRHADFFLPWTGLERGQVQFDNPADVKAASKMARLYDQIRQDNAEFFSNEDNLHHLNVFLCRLLFCYFAEDTGIFLKDIFTVNVKSHTQEDGSDLKQYLERLFLALDTEERDSFPSYIADFPYVNGKLFGESAFTPEFGAKARKLIVDCGLKLNWANINPDIFGSMMQAVTHPDQRSALGMHYTSVVNIMKALDPLFLDELRTDLDACGEDPKKLRAFISRLSDIKIFDPACGSGNFLIISYKEIRKLEIEAFRRISNIDGQSLLPISGVRISQFFGIEKDDFAHEIAILSLWLAEHQMNAEFRDTFGTTKPSLPLDSSGRIVHDNSLRVDWKDVCPKDSAGETYIIGNPPYLGARNQDASQKFDMSIVFKGRPEYKDCDYVAGWIIKAAEYAEGGGCSFAFVTTNSVNQGEQVAHIWPYVLSKGLEIGFAHTSFKWQNNAKGNAGVTCTIVGVRLRSNKDKRLFSGTSYLSATNINAYLTAGKDVYVTGRSRPLFPLPRMMMGSMARDGGHLILSVPEKEAIEAAYPAAKRFFKKLYGTQEFLGGESRWCLWISDEDLPLAMSMDCIAQRIDAVRTMRLDSPAKTTNQYALIPHKFAQRCHQDGDAIIIPRTSSENRQYIPFGFLDDSCVITDSAQVIYGADFFIFALISSAMHMAWVRATSGKFETRIRYSAELSYNNFPTPTVSKAQRERLEFLGLAIIEERERHPEKSLSDLYDPESMPASLKEAHRQLDEAVERCYRARPFASDEERLEHLFTRYEERAVAAIS